MLPEFSVAYEDHYAFDAGHAFPVRAHLADIHFVFFACSDWAVSSATFVLRVSWASLSGANRLFSPLFSTLMSIINASCSLSITHETSLWCSTKLSIAKDQTYRLLVGLNFNTKLLLSNSYSPINSLYKQLEERVSFSIIVLSYSSSFHTAAANNPPIIGATQNSHS